MHAKWLAAPLAIWIAATCRAADKPPYERLLKGEDEKQVAALEKQIDDLWAAGKFAEAAVPAEKILALRRRLQGPDHWQATDAARLLKTVRQAAGLPAEQQRQLAEAPGLNAGAEDLYQRGRYAEAAPLFRKALAIRQKLLGEDHPDTAVSYSNMAVNLVAQGKYLEAESLHRRALAIRQTALGEDHPGTALSYDNLAATLQHQTRYAEAERLCRRALAIRQKALGEDHPHTAISFSNLAAFLSDQAKYAEAEPLCRKALAICRKTLGESHSARPQATTTSAST